MKVISRPAQPGETVFGGGKGVISLNFDGLPKRPSGAGKAGSTTPLQPASASDEIEKFWLRKHQELLAQENASTAQPAPTPPKR